MQIPLFRDTNALSGWLTERRIQQVLVISPHLDDAAFSMADTLRDLLVPAHVYTVFTEADEGSDPAWAHATGFQNAFDEFLHRKPEDVAAMGMIGVPFTHGGIAYGRMTGTAADTILDAVLSLVWGRRTLVLLPLGAGGRLSGAERLLRRVLRRPFGSPVHGDHIWVRDGLGAALAGRDGILTGYYAEIPYHWSNSADELFNRAAGLIPGPVIRAVRHPDPDFKLVVAEQYRSQLVPIMGEKRHYQRKICTAPEVVFLPETMA